MGRFWKHPVSWFSMLNMLCFVAVFPATAAPSTRDSPARPERAEIMKLVSSDADAGDNLGYAVSVDQDIAVLGAPLENGSGTDRGAAYVFRPSGTIWMEQQKLTASDASNSDEFGRAIAVYGGTIFVGAPKEDGGGTDRGAVYVFVHNGFSWMEQQKLTVADGSDGDQFGSCISSGDRVVVIGAPYEDGAGTERGAAYVFVYYGSTWIEQQKLMASDADNSDQFGGAASVNGDVALIGAPGEDGGGTDRGAAYVFRLSGTVWLEQQKLAAADASNADQFGWSVSTRSEVAVVGAPYEDGGGVDRGAAYVFRFSGSTWSEQQKVVAGDATDGDAFGWSVMADTRGIVVGAPGEDGGGTDRGAAYLYVGSGSFWIEVEQIRAADASNGDRFGSSVALDDDLVLAGAPYDDTGLRLDIGAAYLHQIAALSGAGDEGIAPGDELGVWPNPSEDAVTIDHPTAMPSAGEIGIYDLQGRCIRLLAPEASAAGSHRVVWNGADALGRSAPAGRYWVRVYDRGTTISRAFVLLR